jgi:hypothetical protein
MHDVGRTSDVHIQHIFATVDTKGPDLVVAIVISKRI